MWDPISIFSLMLLLNSAELPNQRLSVKEVIKARENKIIIDDISKQVTIRPGV